MTLSGRWGRIEAALANGWSHRPDILDDYAPKHMDCPRCGAALDFIVKPRRDGGEIAKEVCPICGYDTQIPKRKNFEARTSSSLIKWAAKVKARDGACVICGSKGDLEAHHIIPVSHSQAFKLLDNNGITLCSRCHWLVHHKEDQMKALGKAFTDVEVSMGDFERLPAGGYVVRITAVEDKKDKEYLDVVFDIAEGERKGFYADEWGVAHPYAHHFVLSYKEKALGMLKGRLMAIDESNHTNFASLASTGLDEQQLVGRIVGVTIGYYEKLSDRGEVRELSEVREVISAERVRQGNYKTPELKRMDRSAAPAGQRPEVPEGFTWDQSLPF